MLSKPFFKSTEFFDLSKRDLSFRNVFTTCAASDKALNAYHYQYAKVPEINPKK